MSEEVEIPRAAIGATRAAGGFLLAAGGIAVELQDLFAPNPAADVAIFVGAVLFLWGVLEVIVGVLAHPGPLPRARARRRAARGGGRRGARLDT